MSTPTIAGMSAVRDVVDRLEWKLRVTTDFFSTQPNRVFIAGWDGVVGLYHEPMNGIPGPGFGGPRLTLRTRWTNRAEVFRGWSPREITMSLATDLPAGALDRIEEFRESGRLFARVEGELYVIFERDSADGGGTPWFEDLLRWIGDTSRVPCAAVNSAFLEVSRDTWCTDVMHLLRPPGHYVFDVKLPDDVDERVRRTVAHLCEAQAAFDRGGYPEVARVCYRALDEMSKLTDRVDSRYGSYTRDRIGDQIKALKSLCNPDRHGEHPVSSFDRTLGKHAIVLTASLLAAIAQP